MTEGTLRILVATKAAELGVDMPDVARVVVWMPREGVDALVQQAGRVARRGEQGLVVVYCASNLRKAAGEEGHTSSKEVRAAISACGPSLWSFFSEKHCIRFALNHHYEQMPLPEDVHPRGPLCCNMCGNGFVSPYDPSGIDWKVVRPPFGIMRIVPAASKVPVPNGHFDMKAEEKTLASEALAIFRRDFAASRAAVCGGDHDSSKYFPGRVVAKIIEGLPGVNSVADLSVLLSDQYWPELRWVCSVREVRDVTHFVEVQRCTPSSLSRPSSAKSWWNTPLSVRAKQPTKRPALSMELSGSRSRGGH